MRGSLIGREAGKEPQTLEDDEDDIEEDGHAWWAGHKPEFMLSFRLKGGEEVVYSYGDFRGAMFRAGKSLILYFDTATIFQTLPDLPIIWLVAFEKT